MKGLTQKPSLKLLFLFVFVALLGNAQVVDDFSDGDFTNNPTWTGTENDFIVNSNYQLQLQATVAGTSYLSTPHNLPSFDNKEWRFWVRQSFAGSSGNFGRLYLSSTSADLSNDPDGIYLQLGESSTTDAVRLMQRSNGITTQICASADGTIASAFQIGVRMVRNNAGQWSLFVDFSGGTNYIPAGVGTENAPPEGTHIGYRCTYTLGNIKRFYLDDVYAGNEILDTNPPTFNAVNVIDENNISLHFSEPLDIVSAQNISNYTIAPTIGISTATLDAQTLSSVNVQLSSSLSNGINYTITANNIADLSGNIATAQSHDFMHLIAEIPDVGDVIINEFMANPTPVVGLPESEFVEIYNRSNKILNTSGWKLGNNTTFGTVQVGWLMPGEYKILCPTNAVGNFSNSVGVTSFPNLKNNGDDIVLRDDSGTELDRTSYTKDTYKDDTKKDGGWTIERINPFAPCSDQSNWRASVHPNGGTPGTQNSVFDNSPDISTPFIISTTVVQSNELEVKFNKPIKSASLNTAIISTQPTLVESMRNIASTPSNSFSILFAQEISPTVAHTISIANFQDCWGNIGNSTTTFARPEQVDSGDVVLNELLFDQYTGGSDWVELYNNSNKLIDLKGWKFARFNTNNEVVDHKTITEHYLLAPHDYVVIGGDSAFVLLRYPASVPGKFYQLNLPTMANESGSVIVLYPQSNNADTVYRVMDQVIYSSKWHFQLLNDKDGKALERLNPDRPTQDAKNWYTASEVLGFATPGRENSQYYPALYNGTVNLLSDVISPDNDGFEDLLLINYQMSSPEMLGTVNIFDDRGRNIKTLAHNELLGNNGTMVWDGIRKDGQKASMGTYVLLFEAFDINGGNEFVAKKAFTVAGKL